MPIKIASNSDAESAEGQVREGVDILSMEGELSLAARLASDFLSDADFGAVIEHDEATDHVEIDDLGPLEEQDDDEEDDDEDEDEKNGKKKKGVPPQFKKKKKNGNGDKKESEEDDDEDEDEKNGKKKANPFAKKKKKNGNGDKKESEEDDDEAVDEDDKPGLVLLSGGVAVQLLDEEDLVRCFAHYLDNRPRESLSEKAALAHFQDMLGIEELEDGCFGEAVEDEKAREPLAEMLLAMIAEADIVNIGVGDDNEMDEGVLNKRVTATQKAKIARFKKKPKSGAQKKELKLRRRERIKKIGKFKRQEKKRAKRFKRRHGMNADAYAGMARFFKDRVEEAELESSRPIIGFGCIAEGVFYEIGVVEDATVSLEEMGAYGGKMNGSMNKKKKGGKRHEGDESTTGDEVDEMGADDEMGNGKKKGKKKDDKKEAAEAFLPRRGPALLSESRNPGGAKECVPAAKLSEGASLAARMPMLASMAPAKTEKKT